MNPVFTRLALLCLAAPLLGAAPALRLPEPVYDFGRKRSGEVVEHSFILENRGDDTLRIHRILTSCGCTVPTARELEIEPGERTELEVRMDLKGRSGPQRQNVTLHTNDPETRIATLTLSGEAVPAIAVTPRTLNLGPVQEEDPPEGTVELRSTTGDPFTVKSVEPSGDRVDIRVEEAKDGRAATVYITPKPQKGQGYFTDVLLIELEGADKQREQERVLVMWRLSKGVTVVPGGLKLNMGDDTEPVTRYFLVKAPPEASGDFAVKGVEWPGRDVGVEVRNLERLGWRIKVGPFLPLEDMEGEKLVVQTNSKAHPTLEIPVDLVRK